jgi:hypothetical protein
MAKKSKNKKRNYSMQGGVRNYLGKQKTVTVPKKWQSAPDHPETELAYITKAEKKVLIDMNLHGSMKGRANKGPKKVASLNGWGDASDGFGSTSSPSSATDTGDFGSESVNDTHLQTGNLQVGYGGWDGDPRTNTTADVISNVYGKVSPVLDVATLFTKPAVAVAKYGYNKFKAYADKLPTTTTKTVNVPNTNTGGGDGSPTPAPVTAVANTPAPAPATPYQNKGIGAEGFMIRPGVKLEGLNSKYMPQASAQGFMLREGVPLATPTVKAPVTAKKGMLIKGQPRIAKKGWK